MWKNEPVLYRGKYYATSGSGKTKKRKSLRTDRLDVARNRLIDLNNAAESQRPKLIAEIFENYRQQKDDRKKTLTYVWRCLKDHFGHLRPDQVTREVCLSYQQARGVSNGTIIRELGALRAALRWHDPNTPAVFEFPSAPPPRHRHLTRNEVGRLLAACDLPHIRLYIVLALCTGARKTALLELTWDRVDMEKGEIDLGVGADNKGRSIVPINQSAKHELEKAYKARLTSNVIEYQGRTLKDIKRGFMTAAKKAGLPDIFPHALRHTAAVWMAEDEVPMSEIAQYLGHSSTRITEKVYARYTTKHLRKAAASLELGAIAPQNHLLSHLPTRRKALGNVARVTRLELAASAVTEHPMVVKYMKSLTFLFNRHPFQG